MHGYLRHLANFAYVVEAGSITSAARRLDISPSVISESVKILETRIGEPLLERRRNGAVPTTRGAALAEEANTIVQSLDRALGPADGQNLTGRVRISLPGEIAEACAPGAMRSLNQTAPSVAVDLFVEDKLEDHTRFARDLYLRVGPARDYDQFKTLWTMPIPIVQIASSDPSLLAVSNDLTCNDARTRIKLARAGIIETYCLGPAVTEGLAVGDLRSVTPKRPPPDIWAVAGTPHRRASQSISAVANAFEVALSELRGKQP